VKSEYSACTGKSGLRDHASDYYDIITARGGKRIPGIKQEFQNLIDQKGRIGLLHGSLPFKRFSASVLKLLIILVDLEFGAPSMRVPLKEVEVISDAFGSALQIRYMQLDSPHYKMTDGATVTLEHLKTL
jgi:hypothetical protein